MTAIQGGSRLCSRFWMLRRKCMERSGLKLEQRWLWCGLKGLTGGTLWIWHMVWLSNSSHIFSLTQGPQIYPGVPTEPCERWKGREQPEPDAGQYYQRLWSGPEKVSRLVGAAVLQGELGVLPPAPQLESESDRIAQVLICRPLRQPCSLLPTSQIFWGRSPRAGTSRKRRARKRSGNSSWISQPQWTPFTRCTAGWMLILITKCDCFGRLTHHGHLYDFSFFHYLGRR